MPPAYYPAHLFQTAHGTFKFQNTVLITEAYKQFPAAPAQPLGRLCIPFLFHLSYRLPFPSMPAYYIIYERLFANLYRLRAGGEEKIRSLFCGFFYSYVCDKISCNCFFTLCGDLIRIFPKCVVIQAKNGGLTHTFAQKRKNSFAQYISS